MNRWGHGVRFAPAVLAALAAALAACGPPPPGDPVATCLELPGGVRDRTSPWILALCERVDPVHAFSPRNDAERIVFRYAYEGLFDVDCRGELVPRLATSWTATEDDRVWKFELREGRTFDDGEPVTATAVLSAWKHTRSRARHQAHRRWQWTDLLPRDAEADGLVLTIRLQKSDPDLPFRLAEPGFFVAKADGRAWPVGTRGRVPVVRELPDEGTEISFTTPAGAHAPPSGVRFRVLPDTDPRDAFREDTQALLTRDRRAVGFLASRGDARLLPLPWSLRYVLVDPTGAFTWIETTLPLLRTELVRDVLPGDARAPWDPGRGGAPPPAPTEAFAVRFPRHDRDAAAAAERVASLASRQGDGRRWVVVAATPASVHAGETPAVFPLSRSVFDPPPTRRNRVRLPIRGAAYALAETRAHLVIREDMAGVRVGWDAVPRLDDAGWTRRVTP